MHLPTAGLKARFWQIAASLTAAATLSVAVLRTGATTSSRPHVAAATVEAAGEYLTIVGGCNDCHTPGWMETNGNVRPAERLTGSPIGFRGPWGTSFPSNLRLTAAAMTDEDWVAMIRGRNALPPMPWMNLHQMPDGDLVAIRRYLVSLGPAGIPAPAAVPPNEEPRMPYFLFVPQPPRP